MEPDHLAENLKLAVNAAATGNRLSPDGWQRIERRLRRERRRRAILAVTSVLVAAAVAIAVTQAGSRPARQAVTPPRPARLGQLAVLGQTHLPGAGLSMAAGYGSLWVPGVNVTYRVDQAAGRIVQVIRTPGTFPSGCGSGVATGFGSVWVSYGCHGMYRIDARTGKITATIRVGHAGDTVTVAGGLVWVPTYQGDLLRIDPASDGITGQPVSIGDGDWLIVPGAGALWVTSFGTGSGGAVSRIDLATGKITPVRGVSEVSAAGAGSLWTSQVQRVDPATGKVVASVFLPTRGAGDVAFWKGQVWALTQQRRMAMVRVDPAVNRVIGAAVPLPAGSGSDPASITAGPNGLWVTDYTTGTLIHLGIRRSQAASGGPKW